MSGEHCSLCHKGVQVFASADSHKFPSAPSGASRSFSWPPLPAHCLAKAKSISDLHIRGKSFLYGLKLVLLSKRVSLAHNTCYLPLSLP